MNILTFELLFFLAITFYLLKYNFRYTDCSENNTIILTSSFFGQLKYLYAELDMDLGGKTCRNVVLPIFIGIVNNHNLQVS